jgi:hypothetical protein
MITMLDTSVMAVLLCLVFKPTRLLGIVGLTVMFHYYTVGAIVVAMTGAMIVAHYEG